MSEAQLLVTAEQAAERLAVSRARVFAWMASGELPSLKLGASRRVEVRELERFVERLRDADGDVATSDHRAPAGVA